MVEDGAGGCGLDLDRRNGAVPCDGVGLTERESGEVGGGAVEPSGGAAKLRMFEDGDTDRALEADGPEAVVERPTAWIAEEFEVIDAGAGFDDEDLAAVVELGEKSGAAGRRGVGGEGKEGRAC